MFHLIIVLSFLGQTPLMKLDVATFPSFEVCTASIPKKEMEIGTNIQRYNNISPQTITSLCLEDIDEIKE